MRYVFPFAAVLAVAVTAQAQNQLRPYTTPQGPPVVVRPASQVTITDQLPAPQPSGTASSAQAGEQLSEADIARIVNQMRRFNTLAEAVTRPTENINGVSYVQAPSACDTGECLQIDVVEQAPPTIATEMMTVPPQIQMIPRHVPPPQTHSLRYGFDQSFPQLPVVDVDNDTGCGKAVDHYEIAVICVDGQPTQVLNP